MVQVALSGLVRPRDPPCPGTAVLFQPVCSAVDSSVVLRGHQAPVDAAAHHGFDPTQQRPQHPAGTGDIHRGESWVVEEISLQPM
eukprot:scaffold4026_cov39-Prasinocladus_malaysianus.AAC.1